MSISMRAQFILILSLAACGGDDGTPTTDGGVDDADAAQINCDGMPDGTVCMNEFVCLRGVCSPSECGDGYVDEAGGEVCDDGNEIAGDGCEPSDCIFTCAEDMECDNGNPCDGLETCNAALHRCQAGAPVTAIACTQTSGDVGVCAAGGLCAPPGCGDGSVGGTEDCDDMNEVTGDGCESDCTFSCADDMACDDGSSCTGVETCDLATHTCTDPTDLDCNDGDTCTMDSCDGETGCVNALIDGDGDGFAVPTCSTPGLSGDDCDDTNSTVYPGAAELCDMIDNDCDMAVDNDTSIVTCLRDWDGDEYGNPADTVESCTCPAGYIPPRADGETDCQDRVAAAYPGTTDWFSTNLCPPRTICLSTQRGYDYNCDGAETLRWTTSAGACQAINLFGRVFCAGSGWTTATPACGTPTGIGLVNYQTCSLRFGVCVASTSRRTQECH